MNTHFIRYDSTATGARNNSNNQTAQNTKHPVKHVNINFAYNTNGQTKGAIHNLNRSNIQEQFMKQQSMNLKENVLAYFNNVQQDQKSIDLGASTLTNEVKEEDRFNKTQNIVVNVMNTTSESNKIRPLKNGWNTTHNDKTTKRTEGCSKTQTNWSTFKDTIKVEEANASPLVYKDKLEQITKLKMHALKKCFGPNYIMTTDEQNLQSYLTADEANINYLNSNQINSNNLSKNEKLPKNNELLFATKGSRNDKFIDTIRKNISRKKSVMVNNGINQSNLASLTGANNVVYNNQNLTSKDNASINDLMYVNNHTQNPETPKMQERQNNIIVQFRNKRKNYTSSVNHRTQNTTGYFLIFYHKIV